MQPVKFVKKSWVKLTTAITLVMLSMFIFAGTVLAQTPPPSGSNPQKLAPTDIPPDMSLLGVLIFFLVLIVWQFAANFLVRSRIFSDQIDQPSSTSQPEAPQIGFLGRK
ncbi:hypothetical protein [Candidatus Chlorohelix sp.]|uniref:hypothetical protein n=1 Tax=Candidatus Chlorohelix sp. TaxID=3139201 RepID=UPI0030584603